LIWIDLEMTGLEPQSDYIIEIATLVTDTHLRILAEGPVLAIHQSAGVLAVMDDWNTQHHGDSGLIQRVMESRVNEQEAEQAKRTVHGRSLTGGKRKGPPASPRTAPGLSDRERCGYFFRV